MRQPHKQNRGEFIECFLPGVADINMCLTAIVCVCVSVCGDQGKQAEVRQCEAFQAFG